MALFTAHETMYNVHTAVCNERYQVMSERTCVIENRVNDLILQANIINQKIIIGACCVVSGALVNTLIIISIIQ